MRQINEASLNTKNTIFKAMSFLMSILMVFSIALASVPVMNANAVSFDSVFRVFGEDLISWDDLVVLADCSDASDLKAKDIGLISVVYTEKAQGQVQEKVVPVGIGTTHINEAKGICEMFTKSTWETFVTQATGTLPTASHLMSGNTTAPTSVRPVTAAHCVTVDYTTQKVSKESRVSKSDYNNLQGTFRKSSEGSGATGFMGDIFGIDRFKPESNELTEGFMGSIYTMVNALVYVLVTVTNLWFVVQTCIDILFITFVPLRTWMLSAHDSKAHGYLVAIVSEAAVKCLGCNKRNGMIGLAYDGESGVIENPDIKYYVFKRLGVITFLLAYVVLLIGGLLPTLVSMVTNAVSWVLSTILNMFR